MRADDLLGHFPSGATPRPTQRRLLLQLGDALAEAEDDPTAPHIFLVEAPPGVGKSHLVMALARWSGDAYVLTSQKLLQDQYERDFGPDLDVVKGRDNYACERYPGARVPTSQGMCRRAGGPPCRCPYARAKAAALAGPLFCTNIAYFAALRHWYGEHLPRRRLLAVDEAHTVEAQLASATAVAFTVDQMREWFGGALPRLDTADDYRPLLAPHVASLRGRLDAIERALRDPAPQLAWLEHHPSRAELELLAEQQRVERALAGLRDFVEGDAREWVARHPAEPQGLELVPLRVADRAPALLWDAADVAVLSSAFLGAPEVLADSLGLPADRIRSFAVDSPFSLEQRPLVYRPVGRLSRATLGDLEPALFQALAGILREHASDKGLVHAPSYAVARRLVRALAEAAPDQAARLILVGGGEREPALDLHRRLRVPTVLVSPSLREGVDLPDEFLRFQVIAKMPYPDLGDPWTAGRRRHDGRWYALETAKALIQAYGRSCRHDGDYGVTYVLDGQFQRFVALERSLLPDWFLEAADAALRSYSAR